MSICHISYVYACVPARRTNGLLLLISFLAVDSRRFDFVLLLFTSIQTDKDLAGLQIAVYMAL